MLQQRSSIVSRRLHRVYDLLIQLAENENAAADSTGQSEKSTAVNTEQRKTEQHMEHTSK